MLQSSDTVMGSVSERAIADRDNSTRSSSQCRSAVALCVREGDMNEVWRDVIGYEGLYRVSNIGGVKSLQRRWRKKRTLKSFLVKGYQHVALVNRSGKATQLGVHRLVLEAFTHKRPEGKECGHIDGKRSNNILSNLKWVTRSENLMDMFRHGTAVVGENQPNAKLKNKDVLKIKELLPRCDNRALWVCSQCHKIHTEVHHEGTEGNPEGDSSNKGE